MSLRSGFTLVEMLTVFAVVALLAALAIPAAQHAREAARRAQCQNNLRQMGAAVACHESTHRRLPPGRDARAARHHSWCTAVLPYLEQAALLAMYDDRRAWDDPANEAVAYAHLAVFHCPSAVDRWAGKTDYGGNYGSALTGLTPGFFTELFESLLSVSVPDIGNVGAALQALGSSVGSAIVMPAGQVFFFKNPSVDPLANLSVGLTYKSQT